MRLSTLLYSGLLAGAASAAPPPPSGPSPPGRNPSTPTPPRGPPGLAAPGPPGPPPKDEFLDWRTFKGNGANLGAWLASVGVNVLRVPTTYAAWIDVPESQYHRGNQ